MSSEHTHAWTDLAASFALETLGADERAAFERHLAACSACRMDVQAFREVVGELGSAAPRRTPPPSLRARVLDQARAVRPITSSTAARPASAEQPRNPSADRLPRAPGGWFAAAACLLIALGVLALYIAQRDNVGVLEERLASAEQNATLAQTEVARLAAALAQRDTLLATALDPDTRATTLVAEGQPPSLRLFWNREQGRIVAAAADLPPPPAGRTYQLWGIAPGSDPVSLGTFETDGAGRAVLTLAVSANADFTVAAVTEEPDGGSPQPTSQPLLAGQLMP